MSLPSGYVLWCNARGCNPYHPEDWSDEDRAVFYQWKLDWFKSLMVLYKLMPKLMPREHLTSRIRDALDRLKAPPPSQPYTGACPCHPFVPKRYTPASGPHGLLYLATFRRKESA